MAINSLMGGANYFKYLSSAQSVSASLTPKAASSVNDFVFAQMNNKVSSVQSMLGQKYNAYENNLNKYMSFQKDKLSFNSAFDTAASSLKSSSSALANYAKQLGGAASAVGSSNTAVLSVTGTASLPADKSLNVSVSSLASGQKQESKGFTSQLGYTLGGSSKLEITANGKTSTLSFNISNSTSNKDALNEIAGKINSSKLGLTAAVTTQNGMSSLSISSQDTGKQAEFTAKFTGNADKLNMQTTETAQDAKYTVDNVEYTSAKNELTLGESGIKVSLSGKGDATVARGNADAGNALKLVQNFAKDYNNTVKVLKDNSSKSSGISDLSQSYSSTKYQAQSLARIGITTKSDGQLEVDEKKFAAALKTDADSTRNVLEKLAQSAKTKTTQAIANSSKLMALPSMDTFGGGSYNAYKQFYSNPAAASNVLNMML